MSATGMPPPLRRFTSRPLSRLWWWLAYPVAYALILGAMGLVWLDAIPVRDKWHALYMTGAIWSVLLLVNIPRAADGLRHAHADLVVHADGVVLGRDGTDGPPAVALTWAEIVRVDLVSVGSDSEALVFVAAPQASRPRPCTRFSLRHLREGPRRLKTPVWDVSEALGQAAAAQGWDLKGPRRRHAVNRFSGMNWRLQRGG